MAGHKRKHDQDSPNEFYNNRSRSKPTAEARVDPTYGQRSALPGLDDSAHGDGNEEELNYDDQDALSYLRAVRKEATSIPNLLVAPKDFSSDDSRGIYENGVGDHRGWYEDGAYCAAPQESMQTSYDAVEVNNDVGKDPQLAYFDSVLSRYETLRAQLQQTPPLDAVARLDQDCLTHLGKLTRESTRYWRRRMQEVDPMPAQIASMDKDTVLRLIRLLTNGTLLKRGIEVQIRVSRWAWGLLARLPDRGELTSEEIAVVREMGKKAVLVSMRLKEELDWEEGIGEVEAGFDDDESDAARSIINDDELRLDIDVGHEDRELEYSDPGIFINDNESNKRQKLRAQSQTEDKSSDYVITKGQDDEFFPRIFMGTSIEDEEGELAFDDLVAAKARMLAALGNSHVEETQQEVDEEAVPEVQRTSARWNTRATVDMIITVAGEMYGQRDLLEFRQTWADIEM